MLHLILVPPSQALEALPWLLCDVQATKSPASWHFRVYTRHTVGMLIAANTNEGQSALVMEFTVCLGKFPNFKGIEAITTARVSMYHPKEGACLWAHRPPLKRPATLGGP